MADHNGEFDLPAGWEWAEPTWHPLDDPIWKSYRMARCGGRLVNFESRLPPAQRKPKQTPPRR